ncbi:MAG: alanine racemase [Pseudomonadota bacterium]|nr:alanine racemase [Pseudomonadota bacterium]
MPENKPKKPWITPAISAHGGGLNKFGAARHHLVTERIAGVPVDELGSRFGSPLFVLDEQRLRDNARRLKSAFAHRWPRVIHAWSYKTNYLGAVCNTLHQEGYLAEVVSAFEYEKARALGVPGDKIVFNGPHKPRPALERAAREGARIHIDNLDELYLLEEVARDLDKTVAVAIRLNFDTGYTDAWSRFGFNLESGQALDAARRVVESPHLKLTGLHTHIGTFVTDPRAYAAAAHSLCAFMETVEAQTRAVIEYLDFGGGFASKNALQGVYLPPEQIVPAPEQYAEALCDALMAATRAREARGLAQPTLILETGRAVVDDAESLISSVVANKRLPDGRRGVVLDAGVNVLFTGFWYHHDVRPVRWPAGIPEETVLYGPLCMNIDVMRASIQIPPLALGDKLVFHPVGAYNNTQWMQFIEYRPAVVMVMQDGTVEVVREKEDLACVIAQERLPGKLAQPFAEAG